jgi:alcohol dehydrogenase class IV
MDISSEIRIPTLKEVGIGEDDLVDIAESALKENSMKFTPRSATKDEMLTVLNSIYFGAIKAVKL